MANAFNVSSIKSKLDWGNSFNPSTAFPLDIRQWFGSYEEALAAAQTAGEFGANDTTYHYGMQVYVFDGTECKTYLIQGDKSLKEIGANASNLKIVSTKSEMLALTDIESGQQVYVEETSSTWIFKGGDASLEANWVDTGSASASKWYGTTKNVVFYALTQTQFDAIESKDENTLYFITDTKTIYKGSLEVTKSIYAGETVPEVANAVKGKLYINTTDFSCRITLDNVSWIVTSPGYLTDGAEWASADSNKLATIGLIKKGIEAVIASSFAGVVKNPTYDATNLILTLPVEGGENVVVNIPKDKFIKSGKYYEDYPTENPTHHKVIVLEVENQTEPVIIPADALVNIYEADNTGHNIKLTVTSDGKISADAVIDPVAGNALVTTETGLKVDVSNKLDKLANATDGKVLISKADGTLEASSVSLLSEGVMGEDATVIPTASLIAAAIQTAVNASDENKVSKVIGTENAIVLFGKDGVIKDSQVTIGGAALAAVPSEKVLATEAAVSAAVQGATLSWSTLS